jgi:epoxide hydrolase 4
VLLHGFPEFWYSWRHQIPVLSREGFRVIAPDLRGYNLSEKPTTGYEMDTLTTDVFELIHYVGGVHACIVGHDCGAAIAWAFAARYPESTTKLAILNAPPAQRFVEHLQEWQLFKSWYVVFMVLPGLTEFVGGCNRAWLVSQGIKYFSKHDDWVDDKVLELYRTSISRPGALQCMMEYYRKMWTSATQCDQYNRIRAPTLVLWGGHDKLFQAIHFCQGLEDFVPEKLKIEILDGGHWIQQEIPEEVNRRLISFLQR